MGKETWLEAQRSSLWHGYVQQYNEKYKSNKYNPNWSKAFFALLAWFPSPYEKSGQGKLRWSLVPCDWLSFLWGLSPLWTVFPFINSENNEWVTLNNQQKLEMQKKKNIKHSKTLPKT